MKREVLAAVGSVLVVGSCLLTACDNEGIVEPVVFTLSGYTKQANSGAALNGVSILVQDSMLVTVSSTDGLYSFPASYTLTPEIEFTFRKGGYDDASLLFPSGAQVDSADEHRYRADITLEPLYVRGLPGCARSS